MAFLGLLSALVLRHLLVIRMVARMDSAARALAEAARAVPTEAPPAEAASTPLGADPAADSELAVGANPARRRAYAGPAHDLHVSEATVRAWTLAEVIPRARERQAEGALPAGLEIEGASAFLGEVQNGDRLIAVDGQAVSDAETVIKAVARARALQQGAIVGTFARRTPNGSVAQFTVTIAQPYD